MGEKYYVSGSLAEQNVYDEERRDKYRQNGTVKRGNSKSSPRSKLTQEPGKQGKGTARAKSKSSPSKGSGKAEPKNHNGNGEAQRRDGKRKEVPKPVKTRNNNAKEQEQENKKRHNTAGQGKKREYSDEEKLRLEKERIKQEEENRKILAAEVAMRKLRNKVRRKYTLMIFVLVILGLALTYRYSLVISINDQIRRQNAELETIISKNNQIQKEISKETDLDKVRLLAESKLGMQKPDNHQIIYIRVPRKDHALMDVETDRQATQENKFDILGALWSAKEKILQK